MKRINHWHRRIHPSHRRNHGVGALLAMMFMLIFSSLAAAMAIVAEGNLQTAATQLEVNRAMTAAQTGMQFTLYRLNLVTDNIETREGLISPTIASTLWDQIGQAMVSSFSGEAHNIQEPYFTGGILHIGPIATGPNAPTFTVTFTPHPIAGENYDANYYKQAPYDGSDATSGITTPISNSNPLDSRYVRMTVTASAGYNGQAVTRTISMDLRINKEINFAILSKNRVMIGKNVIVDGPIGSSFTDVNLPNGHPIQMENDFLGLDPQLDAQLEALRGTLITNDKNGDNRINLSNPAETQGMTDPAQYDTNGDGYIDAYDFFLKFYDTNGDGKVSQTELDTADNTRAAELFNLIDSHGNNDGFIDNDDHYAKLHGEAYITASKADWNSGAASSTGAYQDYFQGPIVPDYGKAPVTFDSTQNNNQQYSASDFDMSTFQNMTESTLATQAAAQAVANPTDPSQPQMGGTVREAVPYGSAHPYDYYDRPVYKNMTFKNVLIPAGTNALFENCTFIGVTFVQSATDNTDPNYNYSGMQESDGYAKYPDKSSTVDGNVVTNTKNTANNIRFDGCQFQGSIATSAPQEFTQARNKLEFTGSTAFVIKNSPNLTDAQKQLFERSTILAPNYSVELGTYQASQLNTQSLNLTGTIVAGVIDMRGNVNVDGSIITTFKPQNNSGPVIGDTSPDYNTTLGYFSSSQGDLESEIPTGGLGEIYVKYDPTIAMPDGILGPIEMQPLSTTYHEGSIQ